MTIWYVQKWIDGYGNERWQPVTAEEELLNCGWVPHGACVDTDSRIGNDPKLYKSRVKADKVGRKLEAKKDRRAKREWRKA